jgi:hypothetical protein
MKPSNHIKIWTVKIGDLGCAKVLPDKEFIRKETKRREEENLAKFKINSLIINYLKEFYSTAQLIRSL